MKSAAAAAVVAASVLTLAAATSPARAQTDAGMLFKPWNDQDVFESDTSLFLFPSTAIGSHERKDQLTEIRSAGRFRFDTDMRLSPTLGYETNDLFLGHARAPLPHELVDTAISFATPIARLDDKSFVAASAGVGYAGDWPMALARGWYGKGALYAGREIDDHHALLFFVEYNGNRDIFPDVPIPGFAYSFDVDDSLSVILGFPVNTVTWKPTDRWELQLEADIPADFEAKARYKFTHAWSAFAAYSTSTDAYHIREAPHHDRLFFNEQRAEVGLSWQPTHNARFVTAVGYAFNRAFDFGFDVREPHRLDDVSDEPYLRLGLTLQF